MNFTLNEVPLPLCFLPATPMTDDQLLDFCELNEMLWIERDSSGWIHVKLMAGTRTSLMSTKAYTALARWAEQDGRGEVLSNAGFVLPDGSMLGARMAWMLNERWQSLTESEREGFAPRCPDFVIEIPAPSDNREELEAKMNLWIANGAEVAWLIDPVRKAVKIYRPGNSPEVLHEPSSVRGTGPVAGFELVMARVWQ
jgi:Uma2 family endonuclease